MRNLSRWPRGLRHGYADSGLLGLQVRILPAHGRLSVVSFMFWQVEVSATCVLPSVFCLRVIAVPQQWGGLCPVGLSSNEKKICLGEGRQDGARFTSLVTNNTWHQISQCSSRLNEISAAAAPHLLGRSPLLSRCVFLCATQTAIF